MRKAVGTLGIAIIVSILIAGVIAYFVFSFDPQTKATYDGFGRQLSESPWLMRIIFGEDRLWPGWLWFFLDVVIFWGGMATGGALISWGFKK